MVETPRRDRVGLGVIGLGPKWEPIYRNALKRLQNRLTIRMVYDPVEARSRSVAAETEAEPAASLHQILTRSTLQGLLILEPGWCTNGTLELATQLNRPVFLGSSVLRNAVVYVSRLGKQSRATEPQVSAGHPIQSTNGEAHTPTLGIDDQLMPELGLRFTPSSCRLRELLATKLGPVRHIEISHYPASNAEEIASIVDWCSDIVGSSLNWIAKDKPNLQSSDPIEFESIPFDSHRGNGSATVRLCLNADRVIPLLIELKCERGRTRLLSRTHIQWQTDREYADESLTEERTETEILIDQFCRRALGGLNPIGRLSEFIRAYEIAQSVTTRCR